jgi:hypothetical protein
LTIPYTILDAGVKFRCNIQYPTLQTRPSDIRLVKIYEMKKHLSKAHDVEAREALK